MDYYTSNTFATNDEFRLMKVEYFTKTIMTLYFQFLFTFTCVLFVTFSNTVNNFMVTNYLTFLIMGSLGSIAMIIYIALSESKTEIQVAMFTIFETMAVCVGTLMYSKDIIMMAILVTIGITCLFGVYALLTNMNHVGISQMLYTSLTCLVVMSICNVFIGLNILHMFELYFGTLVFFGYIVYDVQYYLSEKFMNPSKLKPDLYIDAAINIYLDVINIFIRMLEIIQQIKGNHDKVSTNDKHK